MDLTGSHARAGFASVPSLARLARPEIGRFAAAAGCMALAAAATAGYAWLVGPVVRALFGGGPLPIAGGAGAGVLRDLSARLGSADPLLLGGLIVAAAALKGAAFFGEASLAGEAGQRILLRLRARMYAGLLASNPLDPIARNRGDLVSRFTTDAAAVESAIAGGLVAALGAALQIVALAGLALALDPVLGLVGLVAFPPAALAIVRIGRALRERRRAVHADAAEVAGVVEETAAGLPAVRLFGAEGLLGRRFEDRSAQSLASAVSAIRLRALSSPLNEILGAAALAATLWYAKGRIVQGALAPDSFLSFFTALFLLYQPVKALGQAMHAVQSGLAALERLEPLLAGVASDPKAEAAPPLAPKRVCLSAARAGYAEGKDVLKGVDLEIEAGARVAVVGPSGAGKTTLLNALQGFLPLRGGALLVDGAPVSLDPCTARRLFAPVPQEPHLFDDTIRVNVLCGRSSASPAQVESACRAAGVLEFARDLPLGLDAPVGRGGGALSVGQRQRVCLARALVSLAPVLLLDEVTASLDGATEKALTGSLDRFLEGRTVLAVTHRLSTARWADRVVLLDNGVVRAAGPSASLLDSDPRLVALFGGQ
ncbi:MAG: ABC transporter ATP-binding protein [Deltaproteobacteria bacterium]|nr:ABC transporter ATP-binding protein [Deltaproteobacteria bacterium]